MNCKNKTIDLISRLRYDMVRVYDLPEFNGTLKAFVMTELDKMVRGEVKSDRFMAIQERISSNNKHKKGCK